VAIWTWRALLIGVIAVGVATILPAVQQFLAVDRCLDAGGAYDYIARICRTDVEALPASSIHWLQAPDRGSTLVAVLVAVGLARAFASLDRRKGGVPAA
jgi:hypothetical protein